MTAVLEAVRDQAVHEIRTFQRDIDRRLADVETYYVSNNPRLSAEIDRLR